MATATRPRVEEPGSPEQAADVMRLASEDGLTIRPVGGRTKLGWGHPTPEPGIELSTTGLNDILEHNEGDFTVRAQAGMKWRDLQEKVAGAGQMLALDPPLGAGEGATLGGILATGDSGPQRHRYGSPRDLVLGVTLVLSDGTVARAGGKVIKNVAGYDLSKLFAGSFGTLGLVAEMSLRLHPRPARTATLTAWAGDPDSLGILARTLSHSTLELEALDVRWSGGSGAVLARFGGTTAVAAAQAALPLVRGAGAESEVEEDDEGIWEEQKAGQRSADGAVVKVSAVQTRLPDVFRAAERAGGSVVGRAAHALCWVRLEPREPDALVKAISGLRADLAGLPCVVQDAPASVRGLIDPWDVSEGPALALMRRLKPRFDPAGALNPGTYIGGI